METGKPRPFYGYIVVAATFCIMTMTGGIMVTFGVFFDPMLTEFDWTRAMLSGASSLRTFLAMLFSIATGKLTDRFGPRPVVTVSGLILGLSFFLMSHMNTVWELYLISAVVTGLGMSGLFVPIVSTISRWFVRKRGIMTGIVMAGSSVGSIIMPPLATQFIINYGWRNAYIIIGLIAMTIIVTATQFVKRDPVQIGQLPDTGNKAEAESLDLPSASLSLSKAIRTGRFWIFCTMFGFVWFGIHPILVHIVIHAIDLGVSAINAAQILSIIGIVATAGRVLVGGFADRIGYGPALLIAFISTVTSLLWILVARELWSLYLFAVVFGFGLGSITVLASSLNAKLFGLGSLSAIMGSFEFIATALSVPGAIVTGYIFDIMGSYQLAFSICAGISVIGLILSLFLRPIIK